MRPPGVTSFSARSASYCVLLRDFTPMATIPAGDDKPSANTSALLDSLSARVQQMPIELQ